MLQIKKIYHILFVIAFVQLITACDMIPVVKVWLSKVDFESSVDANAGNPFQCHIVVAYSQEVLERLQGFDSRGYFNAVSSFESKYRDSIEIFRFDIVPGKNRTDNEIKLKSKIRAKGAFVFAKYSVAGNFAENIGAAQKVVICFKRSSMEVLPEMTLKGMEKKLNSGISVFQ